MEMVPKILGPLPHLDEISFTPDNLKQKQNVIMFRKDLTWCKFQIDYYNFGIGPKLNIDTDLIQNLKLNL